MSKKKIISLCLVVCLLATAIGGTLAYFTDTAKDENTMTMGKVDISQHEYQRVQNADGTYPTASIDSQNSYVLEAFDQDKMLLPCTEINANGQPYNFGAGNWDATATVRMTQVGSYGGMTVFESPNALDKFVVVKNEGNTGAYVRTIVAIEAGSTDGSLIRTSYHSTWDAHERGIMSINGTKYDVIEFVYKGAELSTGNFRHQNGVLSANEMTYPSLSQVYMVATATKEDATSLDGNNNSKLDILVLSQAVQADGWEAANGKTVAQTALDTAFGEVNATNIDNWF